MKITLNNSPEEIEGKNEINIKELLDYKKFTFKLLIVRINGNIVKRDEYESMLIHDNDDVIVLHLISGG